MKMSIRILRALIMFCGIGIISTSIKIAFIISDPEIFMGLFETALLQIIIVVLGVSGCMLVLEVFEFTIAESSQTSTNED